MRRDLHLTDEEFINLLKEYISKRGIKAMFENANLEKDETVTIKGEKAMSKLIELTGKDGKKYCTDRTLITGIDYFYCVKEEKEYTLLSIKESPRLIVKETFSEIIELIAKSEVKEKAPIINFIKLTKVGDKRDVYINVNKVTTISSQIENTTIVSVGDNLVLVTETTEEILAKIEEITK